MNDFYQILGIEKTATQEEIKTAYRKLASENHPDKNNGNLTERMQNINIAYDCLSDEEKRAHYDSKDHYEQMAIFTIFRLFGQHFNTGNHSTMVNAIKDSLQKELSVPTNQMRNAKANFEKMKKMKESIKSNGKVNIFHDIIDANLKTFEWQTAPIQEQIDILTKAISIMEGYSEDSPYGYHTNVYFSTNTLLGYGR